MRGVFADIWNGLRAANPCVYVAAVLFAVTLVLVGATLMGTAR
jgi:hypothetical protein